MSKWWQIETDRGWRGQSETVGVVLLAAIALVLVAAIGLFVFSDLGGSEEDELLLTDLDSDLTNSNVTITHAAGDTLDPEEVNVIIENNTRTLELSNFSGAEEEFSAGETVRFEEPDPENYWAGEYRVIVVHEPSNTILHDEAHTAEFFGTQLRVEDRNEGLTSETVSVWGEPSGALSPVNPEETKWDFDVSIGLEGNKDGTITSETGSYNLECRETGDPSFGDCGSIGDFKSVSFPSSGSTGTINVGTVSSPTTIEMRATYTGSGNIATDQRIDTTEVTLERPTTEFEVSNLQITNNTAAAGEINVTYDVTNTGDITLQQDVDVEFESEVQTPSGDYVGISEDSATPNDDEQTDTNVPALGPGETATASDTENFTYRANSSAERVNIVVEPATSGTGAERNVSFNPAEFDVAIDGTSIDPSTNELSIDYTATNVGDFIATRGVSLETTAYDSGGSQIATPSKTQSQTINGGGDTASDTFTVSLPPATDSVDVNLSTNSDTANTTVDTAPSFFEVTDVTITDIVYQGGNDQIKAEYTVENTGDFKDTQTMDITADEFADGSVEGQTTASMTLEGGQDKTDDTTFHSLSSTATSVEVEVGPQTRGTANNDTTSLSPADLQVVDDSVNATLAFASGEDIIEVEYELENVGDLTHNTQQTITAEFGGSLSDATTTTIVGGGETESGTLQSAALDPVADAGTYTVNVTTADDPAGDSDTLDISAANFDVQIDDSRLAGEDIEVDYTVENIGDLTDTVDVELVSVDDTGTDIRSVNASSPVELQNGQTDSGTLGDTIQSSDITSETVYFELRANHPNGDTASGQINGVSPPFFEITQFDVTPDLANEQLSIDYTVKNNGTLTATRDIGLTVDVGGSEVFNDTNTSVELGPAESVSESFTATVTDPGASVTITTELDTGDQTDTWTRDVDPAEFLFDGSVSATYDPATETATVDFTVQNPGDFTDNQTISLSGNKTSDTDSTEETLGPGASVSDSLTVNITDGGAQSLTVTTDDDSASDTISPAPAEFLFVGGSVSASYLPSSEDARITFEIENPGDFEETQTVSASSNTDTATTDLTLGPGSTSGTLDLTMNVDTAGSQTITVSTDDDSASDTIDPAAATFEVTSFSANYDPASEQASASYTVKNTGGFQATQDIEFVISGSVENSQSATLGPGDDTSGNFDTGVGVGDLNSGDLTVEVRTANDSSSQTFSLAVPEFDITITGASISDGKITANYEVDNTGDFADTQDIILAVEGSDEATDSSVSLGATASPATGSLTSSTLSPPGDGNFDVTVKGSGNSNDASTTISVTPPEFQVSSFSASFNAGSEQIDISYTVTNPGSTDFTATQDIVTSVDGSGINTQSGVTLSPGQSTSNSVSYDVSSGGTYTVEVSTDDDSASTDVSVTGATFQVSTLNANFDSSNEEIDISYVVSNPNSADLTDTQDITTSVEGSNIDTNSGVTLSPGDSESRSLSYSVSTGGTYTVEVSTDDDSQSTDVGVSGPNFQVTSFSANFDSGDEEIDISYEVQNDPSADLADTQDIVTTVASSTFDTTGASLSPGQSTSNSLSYSVGSGGNYNIEVSTDDDSASTDVSVNGPYFEVTSVSASYNAGSQTATASYSIENTGQLSDSQTVTASSNGDSSSTGVSLGPSQSTGGSLTVNINSPGNQNIVVSTDDDSSSDGINVPSPNFQVTSWTDVQGTYDVDGPSNEQVTVQFDYTVKNTGGFPGSTDVELYKDGSGFFPDDSDSVNLDPGQSTSGTLSMTANRDDGSSTSGEVRTGDDSATESVTLDVTPWIDDKTPYRVPGYNGNGDTDDVYDIKNLGDDWGASSVGGGWGWEFNTKWCDCGWYCSYPCGFDGLGEYNWNYDIDYEIQDPSNNIWFVDLDVSQEWGTSAFNGDSARDYYSSSGSFSVGNDGNVGINIAATDYAGVRLDLEVYEKWDSSSPVDSDSVRAPIGCDTALFDLPPSSCSI